MMLFVKTSTGQTLTVRDVELSDRISEIKTKIHEDIGVPIYHMVLHFGEKLMSDHEEIRDFVVIPESIINVDFQLDKFPEEEVYEQDNFNKLYKAWKERNENYVKEEEVNKRSSTSSENLLQSLLDSGPHGPISTIFSYIDPLELILNFRIVCKSFDMIIMELISSRALILNENHLYMMLGKKKFYISENLFLKFASCESLWNDDTFFHTRMPKYSYRLSIKSLLEFCVHHNYFKSLKFLVDNRGFRNLCPEEKSAHSQSSVLDVSLQFLPNCDIFEYLINSNLHGYNLSSQVFEHLVKEKTDGNWKIYVEKLISDDQNEGKEKIFEGFLAAMKKNKSLSHLSKWKEILRYNFEPEKISMNPKCLTSILDCFDFMDWEFILYFLNMEDLGKKFELNQSLADREEFLPYIINTLKKGKKINLEFYLPRFHLINAAVIEGDKEKTRKILEEGIILYENCTIKYDAGEDIHEGKVSFPFLRIKDIEIIELLLPHVNVGIMQYVQSVELGRFEISDLFERFETQFIRKYWWIDEKKEVEMILCNLKKGPSRHENARNLLKKNKVVVWKAYTWGTSNLLSQDICQVLRLSIIENADCVISQVLSSLPRIATRCYLDAFEVVFKIINQEKESDDNCKTKNKSLEIFKDLLQKCEFDKKVGSRVFEMCMELGLKEIAKKHLILNTTKTKSWKNEYLCELLMMHHEEGKFDDYDGSDPIYEVNEEKKQQVINFLKSIEGIKKDEFLICCYRGIKSNLMNEVQSSTCFVNILNQEEELCFLETAVKKKGYGENEPETIKWFDSKVVAAEIEIPTQILSVCRKCYDEFNIVKKRE